jgi:acetone carboxylase gamma subunit
VAAYLPRVLREYTQTDALQEALSSCVRSAAIYPYALPSVVRDFISTGDCSVWWAEKAPTMPFYEIIHHGRPDATLFIRLFHGFHGIGKVIQ